jgi:hypothetical protein
VGWSIPTLAAAFLDGGARFLQLRAKSLPAAALLDAALPSFARTCPKRDRDRQRSG